MNCLQIICNPQSGRRRGLALLQKLVTTLRSESIECRIAETQYAGHAAEIANQADLDTLDGLVVIGGDGTIHEVINGMLTREDRQRLPLGILPGGSGNSLCVDLGLCDLNTAMRAIIAGQTQAIDIAQLTTNQTRRYAFNIIGWGLATDIGIQAEKFRFLGPARYSIVSLLKIALGVRGRQATLTLDGRQMSDVFTMIIACNTRYSGNMKMAPDAKLDDGLLDVIVTRDGFKRHELLALLRRIYDGSYLNHPKVEHYAVKEMTLSSTEQSRLNIDGELDGQLPLQVSMKNKAIEFFHRA